MFLRHYFLCLYEAVKIISFLIPKNTNVSYDNSHILILKFYGLLNVFSTQLCKSIFDCKNPKFTLLWC